MSRVALHAGMDPDAAESAIRAALAKHPDAKLTVLLNGFDSGDFRVIRDRLPGRYKAHHLTPNWWLIVGHQDQSLTVSVLSGRFDAAGRKVSHAWAVERAAGTDLILGTELRHRPDSTLDGNGYGLIHGHGAQGETAVEYSRDRFREVAHRFIQVWGGGGQGRFAQPAYALAVVLEDQATGQRLLVVQNHNKAHLFKGSRFYDPRNIHVWMTGVRRQAAAVRQLRAEYHTDAEIVSGDFNASGPWLARNMAKLLPGFSPGRGYEFGNAWVHGLRVGKGQSIAQHGASDHVGKRLRFHW